MNVIITLEHRFDRTPDGAVWTRAGFARSFYSQYLDVFDHVRVVARVRDVPNAHPGSRRADGDRVSFCAVPYYVGPTEYLQRRHAISAAIQEMIRPDDAVVLRVGSTIAALIEPLLKREGKPYGLEVLGDPYDAFAPGTIVHPLRPLFRLYFAWQLRQQCASAPAVSYCTEQALQRRYPAVNAGLAMSYSDVELPPDAFVASPRMAPPTGTRLRLVTVGSLEMLYKGIDVLIDATAVALSKGVDLSVAVVGDGQYRSMLESRARSQSGRIQFLGQVPSGADGVRRHLDESDIFILASRSEGLPRALIEAMARGLPCIATTVGGIPELLDKSDLVPPGDTAALAAQIVDVASNPWRYRAMSARNLARAQDYSEQRLRSRRNEFYAHVRTQTEAWLRQSCPSLA